MKPFVTKLLLLDAEYGGVRSHGEFCADFSILEIYARVVTMPGLALADEIELKIKPANGQYVISVEGMNANKIDLNAHDKIALSEGQAKEKWYNFLKKNSDDGKTKLIPVGKGVTGDITYLQTQKFISQPNWEKFCSVENLELGSLILMLKFLKKMPQTVKPSTGKISNSMEAVGAYLGLPLNNLHSAKGDVILSQEILRELIRLLDHIPGLP